MQLAGAAGQHDAAAGDLVEAARLEPVAHQLEGLLEARRDDADQQRFRHVIDVAVLLLADLRHGDHLALVERRGDRAAEQRLQPLGMGQRRRQAARDVVGDVHAADRDRVGEDQIAVEKHADRRRAAAHVDDGDAEIHLVLDEAGEPRGVGADDQRLDFEMRASERRRCGCARPAIAAVTICMLTPSRSPTMPRGSRMPRLSSIEKPTGIEWMTWRSGASRICIAALEHLAHVGVADLAPADADLGLDDARGAIAARQVDDDALDRARRPSARRRAPRC